MDRDRFRRTLKKLKNLILYELFVIFLTCYTFILTTSSRGDTEYIYREVNSHKPKMYRKHSHATKQANERTFLTSTKNPAIIWWTQEFNLYPQTTQCGKWKCDIYSGKVILPTNTQGVYLFYGSRTKFYDLPLPRNPERHIWGLSLAESPKNAPLLVYEKYLNLFNYSSSFSRYSDLPFPLHYMLSLTNITYKKYYVKTSVKNLFLKELSPILYLQSDCDTWTERDKYVTELMKYQRVDSYGRCLKNKELPSHIQNFNYIYMDKIDENDFLKFMAKYKFVITIENGVCKDYVTEKFWRAIHLGVVPIYFGSPSIRDWLPNEKSAILIEDFPTPKLLSLHIDELMRDDDLYEEYLEHKTEGKISNSNLNKEIRARPYQTNDEVKDLEFVCFLCKKLHVNKNKQNIVTKSHYNCSEHLTLLSS